MSEFSVLITARSFGKTSDAAYRFLEENGCTWKKIGGPEGVSPEELTACIGQADAVIAGLEPYDAAVFEKAPRLKVISRYGVGTDAVDLAAAKAAGIAVTITPGANGDSVADLAVALMLSCARNLPQMDRAVQSGRPERPQGLEMFGKTLGVVGAGRIGRGVARRCRGFSMKVLCFDQIRDEDFIREVGGAYVDFETLLREADFITIHAPYTEETKNLFGAEQFRRMKNDAILVNTARGGIVDETALFGALQAGEIRAAALDVADPQESPLRTLPNCILTPHAGAATREASEKMSLMAAQNAVAVLKGTACRYTV